MNKEEAIRNFYEVAKEHFICQDDFFKVDMCNDGLRAYVEAKCKRPLSEAKKRSMIDEFYLKTDMELYLF